MIDRARVVVIGGGIGGCSILYWLARLGWSDVALVERSELTSGSTFHSAGLVGQLRNSLSLTQMMMNSVDLYRTLGEEVDLETGWREVGSLRLASSKEHMEELERQAAWAETFGLPLHLISADEAQSMFPPMSTDGVLGAALLPSDGYVDPSQLTLALGTRRAPTRRDDPHEHARDRRARREQSRARRRDRPGHDRVRVRRERRRHLRPRDRALGRRARAARGDGPSVRDHEADGTLARHADAARPRATRLLPRRERRARRRRLRTQSRRSGVSAASRATSTHACSSRTGTASRRSSRPRSHACPNWPTPRS